jgi:hypothetical protein
MTGRIQVAKRESNASTLPEVGKIKIGIKHETKGYPMSLDYFRPTGNFANEFTKVFGDQPRKLSIAFISDDLNEVCNQRYECWEGGKRWGWSDGENYTVFDKTKGDLDKTGKPKGAYVTITPDTTENQQLIKSVGKWDEMLTLKFVILELKGIMGYWSYQTKAKAVSIPAIIKSFDFVRERAGSIIGFPFSLMVEKKTGYSPGEAKNYPVVTLVPNFSEESIEQVRQYIDMGGAMNRITTRMIEQNRVLDALPVEQKQTLQIGGGDAV